MMNINLTKLIEAASANYLASQPPAQHDLTRQAMTDVASATKAAGIADERI